MSRKRATKGTKTGQTPTASPDTVEFELGTHVYLKSELDTGGIITGILFTLNGTEYRVRFGTAEPTFHYAAELTASKFEEATS